MLRAEIRKPGSAPTALAPTTTDLAAMLQRMPAAPARTLAHCVSAPQTGVLPTAVLAAAHPPAETSQVRAGPAALPCAAWRALQGARAPTTFCTASLPLPVCLGAGPGADVSAGAHAQAAALPGSPPGQHSRGQRQRRGADPAAGGWGAVAERQRQHPQAAAAAAAQVALCTAPDVS